MSHELRTPLNVILGFAQQMTRHELTTPSQQSRLDVINRSGSHLLKLINNILSLSKIEAGQMKLDETAFDFYALLDDIEQMLLLKAKAKGLQLIFDRSEKVPQYICTDESKLRQVLMNLLENAIKFTSSGSVTLQVKVTDRLPPSSHLSSKTFIALLFWISDTGSGIAREELESLFKPFVQTETGKRSQTGTGLGLPISRQFIKLMSGDIRVKSKLGKGTTFRFYIRVGLADALTPESLSVLPQGLLVQLHQAAELGDDQTAKQLIEQIQEFHNPLKIALAQLVEELRLDTISDLTKFSLESERLIDSLG